MIERHCELIPIASSRACELWMCEDCDTVHMNIGPVSLRLKLAHFLKAMETLQDAARQLRDRHHDNRPAIGSDNIKHHH